MIGQLKWMEDYLIWPIHCVVIGHMARVVVGQFILLSWIWLDGESEWKVTSYDPCNVLLIVHMARVVVLLVNVVLLSWIWLDDESEWKVTSYDPYIYIYIKSMGIYQPENLMSNGSSRHDDAAQTK